MINFYPLIFFSLVCILIELNQPKVNMESIQLEFNIDDLSERDHTIALMQKQVDHACKSMDKVRRRLFAEVSSVKKMIEELKIENRQLRDKLQKVSNEKTMWTFEKEGYLFDLQESG